MASLAGGDLTSAIAHAEARDEMGAMARAVAGFRENAPRVEDLSHAHAAAEKRNEDPRVALMQRFGAEFGAVAEAAVNGDFARRIGARFDQPSLDRISANLNTLMESVDAGLAATSRTLAGLADGDLSTRMDGPVRGRVRRASERRQRAGRQAGSFGARHRGGGADHRHRVGQGAQRRDRAAIAHGRAGRRA
jgi:methyl-accepting chemotaxis protein